MAPATACAIQRSTSDSDDATEEVPADIPRTPGNRPATSPNSAQPGRARRPSSETASRVAVTPAEALRQFLVTLIIGCVAAKNRAAGEPSTTPEPLTAGRIRPAISSKELPSEYPAETLHAPKCQSAATPNNDGEYEPVGANPVPLRRKAPSELYPLSENPLHCTSPCPNRAWKCPTTSCPSARRP